MTLTKSFKLLVLLLVVSCGRVSSIVGLKRLMASVKAVSHALHRSVKQ
jgi:ABC-type Mn2+/Zn2+ transport system permease subunit